MQPFLLQGVGKYQIQKKEETRKKILEYLQARGFVSVRQMARDLNLNRIVVKRHLTELDGELVKFQNRVGLKTSSKLRGIIWLNELLDEYPFGPGNDKENEKIFEQKFKALIDAHELEKVIPMSEIFDFVMAFTQNYIRWYIPHILHEAGKDDYMQPFELERAKKNYLSWFLNLPRWRRVCRSLFE